MNFFEQIWTSTMNEPLSEIQAGPHTSVSAARGSGLRARNWRSEALLRMFENVLEIAEEPRDLVVYAALGKAARDWPSAKRIASALLDLEPGQTLVLQSGRPVGVIPTHPDAPLVVSAVNNTVGSWATAERFYEREAKGQTIWGGLTAAAWQYIGRQGVLQGTYELLRAVGVRHFGMLSNEGSLAGRWMLTAGLGGMGSSQPISAAMLGLSCLVVEVDGVKIERLHAAGGLNLVTTDLGHAVNAIQSACARGETLAVALHGNAAWVYQELVRLGVTPDIVTDQTAAHDARMGYLPVGYELEPWRAMARADPQRVERDARASMSQQFAAMVLMADRGSIPFENGNNLRVQVVEHRGDDSAAEVYRVPGFMEYLRPLFTRGIGPFRWVALSGDPADLAVMDELVSGLFPERPEVAQWIALARRYVPQQGLPARSCWLGHGERSALAVAADRLVREGVLSAPVLFTRDHLDSAGMTHPRIGTEGMRDGSDGVSDWPLLDAMLVAATGADLVAVHAGGGGYSGWMQSTGVSIVADGEPGTAQRLKRTLDADSGLGVIRHAIAGYPDAERSAARGGETGDAPVTAFVAKDSDERNG